MLLLKFAAATAVVVVVIETFYGGWGGQWVEGRGGKLVKRLYTFDINRGGGTRSNEESIILDKEQRETPSVANESRAMLER